MSNETKLRHLERYLKHLRELLNNPEKTTKMKYEIQEEYDHYLNEFNELRVQL